MHYRWRDAIKSETECQKENQTSKMENPPSNHNAIESKMVFAVRKDIEGTIVTLRARIVGKGFQQEIDKNLYAIVIDLTTVRVLSSMMVSAWREIHEMYVDSAFINGDLSTYE